MTNPAPYDYRPAFCAIGEFVFQWAYVELSLDLLVTVVFHLGGGNVHTDKLRSPLSKRISFLSTCFQGIAQLQEHAEEVLPLIEEAKVLANETRHFVVHGALKHPEEATDDVTFVKSKLDEGTKKFEAATLSIQLSELSQRAVECEQLMSSKSISSPREKG
jgi:hypothetical protein